MSDLIMPFNAKANDEQELKIYSAADKITHRLYIALGVNLPGLQQGVFDNCLDKDFIRFLDLASMLMADPAKPGAPPVPVPHRVFRVTDAGMRRARELQAKAQIAAARS